MKAVLALVIGSLVAGTAVAQEVHVDYDRWARMTTYRTFAWLDTPETSVVIQSPLMDEHIKNAIIEQMASGRLDLVESDPDLYVTYHLSLGDKLRVNTMSLGYGYPGSWYWDPYWGGAYTTTSVSTYTEGTLVIDVWDARTKLLIWRGSATAEVASTSEKNTKKIDKAVKKIAAKWQKMKPGF